MAPTEGRVAKPEHSAVGLPPRYPKRKECVERHSRLH